MGAPQVIFVALAMMSFTVAAIKHGEPRSNFSVLNTLINISIYSGLLYWGGFFG